MFHPLGFFRTSLRRLMWFIDAWIGSCPGTRVISGLPFVLLALFVLASYYFVGLRDVGLRASLLDNQLKRAWDRDDMETALLLIQRQLQTAPDSPGLQFELARVHAASDEHAEAVRLMRKLALTDARETPQPDAAAAKSATAPQSDDEAQDEAQPEQPTAWPRLRGGDLRAAIWLIENEYLARPWEQLTPQEQAEFGGLLEWVAASSPKDLRAQQLYAEALLKAQRYPEALPVLVSLIPTAPGIGLRAAVIARGLGEEDRADRYARESLMRFTQMAQQEPANPALAMAVARCQLFLRLYPEAFQTIDAAIARAETDQHRQQLGQVLAETIVTWVAALESKVEQDPRERLRILRLLQTAVQYAPNNARVLQMVAKQVLSAVDDDDQQVAALRDSLTRGTSPGMSHFIQGTAAVMQEDFDAATLHLELAAKTLPQSGVILNNLAFVLSEQQDPDLQRALQVSNAAIKHTPHPSPHFFETRGQILLKLGRYVDAVADLEVGLAIPELAAGIHLALAECYKQLGRSELSQQHQRAAEQAGAKPAVSNRPEPAVPTAATDR